MHSLLMGIAGGSGSGKTTLATQLHERFDPNELLLVSLDSYYRDRQDLSHAERRLLNFDHPDAFDEELLVSHLEALRRGEAVDQPVYDYTDHARSGYQRVESAPVVVLEGILVFALPRVTAALDLKVYVETAADLRVLRRLRRDVAERGRNVDSVIKQYLTTVRPMHERFIEPNRVAADLTVSGERDTTRSLDLLEARARQVLSGRALKG